MRIPLSWIDQYSPLPSLSIAEISRRFTLGSCEVERVLACIDPTLPELWSQVQLVEVLRIDRHPKAEKLSLPTIATSNGELQLVCGADNLYSGLKTLWAPAGTELRSGYNGEPFTLKDKEVMGVLSRGMLCSERELSISDNHEGIIDLSQLVGEHSLPLGLCFAEIVARLLKPGESLTFNGNETGAIEFILDVDNKSLTHRPDMWGLYGIAREFGAVFPVYTDFASTAKALDSIRPGKLIPYGPSPFRAPYDDEWLAARRNLQNTSRASPNTSPVSLEIEAESSCLSYCALAVDGIRVGQSPQWLQRRLHLLGVNVINSVVDVSNYVMLELGIPNHIFDRDQLRGDKICVYRLREAQNFQTLDEQQRNLLPGDTVVADAARPQVIAGIMGGQHSSVDENTERLLLEVAVWNSSDVHKTSMRLGLRSESSLRYEKSLDPYSIERSLWRLVELLQEVHPEAQVCGQLQSYYKAPDDRDGGGDGGMSLHLETSTARIARTLGYPLDKESAKESDEESNKGQQLVCQIFENLGFRSRIDARGATIQVEVPSFRTSKDISLEEDLIEEVGRIIGFDNIIPTSPLTTIRPSSLSANQHLEREIRNFLALNGGAQEVLSYPLIGVKLLEQAHWSDRNEALCLAKPLNPDQDRMRPSLIPSHLELISRNAHRQRLRQFCIFELGRSYHSAATLPLAPEEQRQLLVCSYSEDRQDNPILELRNLCQRLLRHLGLGSRKPGQDWRNSWETWPDFLPSDWDAVHPYERLMWQTTTPGEHCLALNRAHLFSVHPALLHELKLKGKLAMACLPFGPVLPPKDLRHGQTGPLPRKRDVQFRALQRFPGVEFDCTVLVPPQTLASQAIEALEQGAVKYPRMTELLQKVLVRAIFPAPGKELPAARWLTLQCIFADRHGTLQSEEVKQLEDQTVDILQQAGFPLKMENAD